MNQGTQIIEFAFFVIAVLILWPSKKHRDKDRRR